MQPMLKLEATGAGWLVALSCDSITEYAPLKMVKMAITGTGKPAKEQVADMF